MMTTLSDKLAALAYCDGIGTFSVGKGREIRINFPPERQAEGMALYETLTDLIAALRQQEASNG